MKVSKIIYKILLLTIFILMVVSSAYKVQGAKSMTEMNVLDGGSGGATAGSGTAGTGTGLPSLDIFQPTLTPGEAGGIMQIIGTILVVLRTLGAIITVVSIAIIGFCTILGSASEKAEYQQKLTGVIIAGIFLVASTSIAKLIMDVAVTM